MVNNRLATDQPIISKTTEKQATFIERSQSPKPIKPYLQRLKSPKDLTLQSARMDLCREKSPKNKLGANIHSDNSPNKKKHSNVKNYDTNISPINRRPYSNYKRIQIDKTLQEQSTEKVGSVYSRSKSPDRKLTQQFSNNTGNSFKNRINNKKTDFRCRTTDDFQNYGDGSENPDNKKDKKCKEDISIEFGGFEEDKDNHNQNCTETNKSISRAKILMKDYDKQQERLGPYSINEEKKRIRLSRPYGSKQNSFYNSMTRRGAGCSYGKYSAIMNSQYLTEVSTSKEGLVSPTSKQVKLQSLGKV